MKSGRERKKREILWEAGGHLVRESSVCVWSLCFCWRPNWPGSETVFRLLLRGYEADHMEEERGDWVKEGWVRAKQMD